MRWFAVADQRSLTAPGRAPPHRTARPAVPRNPDHALRDVPRRDAEITAAGRRGHAGEDRRRHRRGRHGVPGPGAGGRHGAVPGPVPGRFDGRGDRTREGPDPRPRPRRHQRGIPRGGLVHGVRRRHRAPGSELRGVGGPAFRQLPLAHRNPLRSPRARGVLVVHHLAGHRRGTAARRRRPEPARPRTPRLPGRRRRNDGLHRLPRARPVADRRRHRRPRPGPAARRTLPRQRHPVRPGGHPRRRTPGRADRGDHGRRRTRFCPGAAQAGPADRGRPAGPDLRRFHEGHAPDAVEAAERRGSAAAGGRGLRGARTARHRPVRGADPAQGRRRRGRGARIPGPGIRAVQARRPGRPALCAHRPAGPGHPLRRRGHPGAEQDGRRGLGQHQVQGPQGRQGNRRRADPAVLGPDGLPRLRLRRRTPRGSASWRKPSRMWRPRTS